MGIFRLTVSIIPGSKTDEEFMEMCKPLENFLKEKSYMYYAHAFEYTKKNQLHYHACFTGWKKEGVQWYTEKLSEILNWQKLDKTICNGRTGKKTGFFINVFKKGTQEEFVGYLFKDRDGNNTDKYECIGWDLEETLSLYQKGVEESKISWYTAYVCAEFEYNTYMNSKENSISVDINHKQKMEFRKNWHITAVKIAIINMMDLYKDKLTLSIVCNIRRLLDDQNK
jgi:hypothetical protein